MYGGEGWLKVHVPRWVLGHCTYDFQLMLLVLIRKQEFLEILHRNTPPSYNVYIRRIVNQILLTHLTHRFTDLSIQQLHINRFVQSWLSIGIAILMGSILYAPCFVTVTNIYA